LKLGEGLRIVDQLGRGLDGADLGARVRDAQKYVLLLLREAFDRVHHVGDEIRAALVLAHHLTPGRFHLLVLLLDGVVAASAQAERGAEQGQGSQQSLHSGSPRSRR
jgi:hypothetical protein